MCACYSTNAHAFSALACQGPAQIVVSRSAASRYEGWARLHEGGCAASSPNSLDPPTSNNDRESHLEKSMRLLAFSSQTSKHHQAMSLIRALSHRTCDLRPLRPINIQSKDPSHRGKLPKGPL